MNTGDAIELIRAAIPTRAGAWADLGAGDGTFTQALAELLPPASSIHAVDRDPGAVDAIRRGASTARDARVIPIVADFTQPLDRHGLGAQTLDGILLANALHFVRDAGDVLARLTTLLRVGGRVVVVEYDRRAASPWVPYPIPEARMRALAESAGLTEPVITARRPSAFGGGLYVAAADRNDAATPLAASR